MGRFGSLFGHVIQACNLQIHVLQVVEVAGVSSSLKASKDKGEGDGSETFLGRLQCWQGIEKVQINFFMLLEDQKLLSGEDWSRWLQKDTQGKEGSKIKVLKMTST